MTQLQIKEEIDKNNKLKVTYAIDWDKTLKLWYEDEQAFRAMHRKVYRCFPISRVYQASIPTCPAGYWMFGFASKKYHPLNDFDPKRWNDRDIKTWYYTTNLHQGAFMLPKYVEDLLEEEEKRDE